MAKVYTGKLTIPGDKIDDYFAALTVAEQQRAPFRADLQRLHEACYDHLSQYYSARTAHQQAGTLQRLIEFRCGYTDVESLQAVTRSMANSYFRRWYRRKVWDDTRDGQLKTGLRQFFQFLASEKGIENPKVVAGLQ